MSLLLVPVVTIPLERLPSRAVDPIEAFLLSCFDGESTGEEITRACGLDVDEVLAKLTTLIEKGLVALR